VQRDRRDRHIPVAVAACLPLASHTVVVSPREPSSERPIARKAVGSAMFAGEFTALMSVIVWLTEGPVLFAAGFLFPATWMGIFVLARPRQRAAIVLERIVL
jgi:hypothetical protein